MPSSVVVDKNYLERPELEAFLRVDDRNRVLLHDFSAIESLAGRNPIKNLSRTLSVVSKFPTQVFILKNSRKLLALGQIHPELRFEMVDWPQTKGFPTYCEDVRKAELGDKARVDRIMANSQAANSHLVKMLTIVPMMIELVGRLASQTDPEVLSARRKPDAVAMPGEGGMRLLHEIFDIASAIAERGNAPRIPDDTKEAARHYVFRFAIALRLFALRWAQGGSDIREARQDKLRNDFVDLMYVTCATYWDDFLTAESKMADIYGETSFLANQLLAKSNA